MGVDEFLHTPYSVVSHLGHRWFKLITFCPAPRVHNYSVVGARVGGVWEKSWRKAGYISDFLSYMILT